MHVDCLVLGLFETNSYIVRSDDTAAGCVIIDTGLDSNGVAEFIEAKKLTPEAIILTHGHADHLGGVGILKKKYPEMKIYAHEIDAPMLTGETDNLSSMTGSTIEVPAADMLLSDGDMVEHAGVKLEIFHTPGHTQGGISLYSSSDKVLFSGDTLFADSVGRTDFPGGDMAQLLNSIRTKLFVLPDDTIVYPGHGPATTIGNEKTHNAFVR